MGVKSRGAKASHDIKPPAKRYETARSCRLAQSSTMHKKAGENARLLKLQVLTIKESGFRVRFVLGFGPTGLRFGALGQGFASEGVRQACFQTCLQP